MKITDVFKFYQDYIKPLYAEIEAKRNQIPVELLFETYASFDHLKRFYLNEEDEKESSLKALSHLKRGVLDAFKLKLKYFNESIDAFLSLKIDFELIDNGNFIIEFHKNREEIYKIAKEARLNEGRKNIDEAFEKWYEVSVKIDIFEERYLNRLDTVEWAKKKTFKWLNRDSIRGFTMGIISGILSSVFVWWFTN